MVELSSSVIVFAIRAISICPNYPVVMIIQLINWIFSDELERTNKSRGVLCINQLASSETSELTMGCFPKRLSRRQ